MTNHYGIITKAEYNNTAKCNNKSLHHLKICHADQWQNMIKDDALIAWLQQKNIHSQKIYVIDLPQLDDIIITMQDSEDALSWAMVHDALSDGCYMLPQNLTQQQRDAALLGFGLAHYHFDLKTQHKNNDKKPYLILSKFTAQDKIILAQITAIWQGRDLINTPANILTPKKLMKYITNLGKEFTADVKIFDRLKKDFPLTHIVGDSSAHKPRFAHLTWGKNTDKHVILIGKGVCFDSGGLDIKPSSNMLMMKKDMGGAAHMIALARMIMATKLPLKISLLIPAAENAVSERSYRPSDVITARNGQTIEIGNTDAEGRLLLADALCYAQHLNGDLIIDYATLTGAARVALGTDLPACFCNDDAIWQDIDNAQQQHDPLWRLPLHTPYRKMIDSQIADIHSTGKGGYGGAITAALFLKHFVPEDIKWLHVDVMAYNLNGNALKKAGGEIQGIRSLYMFLRHYAGQKS